jgi:hypothetical protein
VTKIKYAGFIPKLRKSQFPALERAKTPLGPLSRSAPSLPPFSPTAGVESFSGPAATISSLWADARLSRMVFPSSPVKKSDFLIFESCGDSAPWL